jgi:hypothetical protein
MECTSSKVTYAHGVATGRNINIYSLIGNTDQWVFVQHIALYGKLSQHLSRPLAELCRPQGIDPVAHRDDDIQIIAN